MHLPGSWASTGNALEILAFHAKDVLVVIDDFAPQGNATDVARYHATADRVLRAAGNQAGARPTYRRRGYANRSRPEDFVLSTGEDIPRAHSIRARLLILELSKGAICAAKLSECQTAAVAGDYARAMSGFLMWMAGRLEAPRASLSRRVAEASHPAVRDPAHARTPDIISDLQAGFESYVEFCVTCGAIDEGQGERLRNDCWRALREAALAQTKHHAASEPAARSVSLVRACLSSGQAHLAERDGGVPKQSPEDCGWRLDVAGNWQPHGRCIGWTDGRDIYLEPTAAYEVVQIAGRNAGDVLPIAEQTLRKRLREKGLLASTDVNRGTLTVRRRIGGLSKEVLRFLRVSILPEGEDELDSDSAVND